MIYNSHSNKTNFHKQWPTQGRGPGGRPPLLLDQTEARMAEKCFFENGPSLSQGLDDRPPPPLPSEGLDPPLTSKDFIQLKPLCSRNLCEFVIGSSESY